jgi:hypothetical protein
VSGGNGPWGRGPVSGLPWWSGVSWRGLGAMADFVAGPRRGRGVDLIQMFAPVQQGLADSWDMLAGGAGDDPATHDGVLTCTKGGKQASWIWGNPVTRATAIAYTIRVVPINEADSNENGRNPRVWEDLAAGKRDDVWRRLGRRFAWNDRQFGRTAPLLLEPAWEMSGGWYPHSIAGAVPPAALGLQSKAAWELFPEAWARIVGGIRAGYREQSGQPGEHCPYLFVFRPARATLDGVRLDKFLPCPSTWDALGLTAHDNAPVTSAAAPRASWHPHHDKHGKCTMEGWTLLAEIARKYRRGIALLEWAGYPEDSITYRSGDGGLFVRSLWDFLQEHRELVAAECFFDREATSLTSRPTWAASRVYTELWGQPVS